MTRRRAAEQSATRLLDESDCATLPIPVEQLARACGALVNYQPFDAEDISGLLFRKPGQAPVIGVNSANSLVRQRFTIAHELGHLRLHKGELILDRLARVNFRDSTSSAATDTQEIEANAFAATLLMPQPLIEEQLQVQARRRQQGDEQLVETLAKQFQVSRAAMEYRLINLGYYTPSG